MNKVLRFERNAKGGRDFVVGDIHGCFKRLMAFLKAVNFDFTKDRLFGVGDLIDRGPDNLDVFDWLGYTWFHTVRGNHDQMAIDAWNIRAVTMQHIEDGALWLTGLTEPEFAELAWSLDALPHMIEVDTPFGLVGIVHADVVGNDWVKTGKTIQKDTLEAYHTEGHLMWNRDRFRGFHKGTVEGVDLMIVGHSTTRDAYLDGNVLFLDSGAVWKDVEPNSGYAKVTNGFTLYDMTNNKFYLEKDYV